MLTDLFMSRPQESTNASDWILIAGVVAQAVAVVAAIGASIVALVISARDRKTLLVIARRDREHARLRTELDYAVRLSSNRNMGGSNDSATSHRLGAEALALALVVGENWVPRQFQRAMDYKTTDESLAMLDNDEAETPQWLKDKIEAGVALQRIMRELYRED